MKIKSFVQFTAAAMVALGSVAATANEQFAALSEIDATPMSSAELVKVEGKGHGDTALGALLLDVTNGRVADTPAWENGLTPGRALGKAQVGKNAD